MTEKKENIFTITLEVREKERSTDLYHLDTFGDFIETPDSALFSADDIDKKELVKKAKDILKEYVSPFAKGVIDIYNLKKDDSELIFIQKH